MISEQFTHRLKLRWAILIKYLCLSTTGVLAAISPSQAAEEQLQFFLTIWIVFFVVGAVASTLGIILGRWSGEAFGLPLLSSALIIYAIILMVRFQAGQLPLLAFAFMIMGFGFGLLGRWLDVLKLLRAARRTNRHGN